MWSWFPFFFNIIIMIITAISIELTPLPWFTSFWFCNMKYCWCCCCNWTRHYSWCCIHRSRHVMACSNHATNMHAPLHWLNNRLSRVCAGAPYLSTDTSSHRSTSWNVFLRSHATGKLMWLLLALVIFHRMQWDFLKFGWLKGWREVGKCYGYMCLDLYFISNFPSSTLLLWFQMDFHFPFFSCSLHCDDYERNEFSLWPTKRELCDYLLRKLMQCNAKPRLRQRYSPIDLLFVCSTSS